MESTTQMWSLPLRSDAELFRSQFVVTITYLNLDSAFNPAQYLPQGIGEDYEFKISVLGAYGGVQAQVRIWKFLINPYVLQMQELSKTCQAIISGPIGGGGTADCAVAMPGVNNLDPDTSFTAFGIFLGLGGFRLNVYSKALLSPNLAENNLTNYSLSYTFGLSDEIKSDGR